MVSFSPILLFLAFFFCWGEIGADASSSSSHPFQLSQLLSALNVTLDPIVDATPHQMFRSYHDGNYCPFRHKVLSKLLKGEAVKILIVGGSVTWGAELRDRLKQRWSTSFAHTVQSPWYNGSIDIENIAAGACNIDTWIYKVNSFSKADMLIVDLSVNDQGFDLQTLPHLYRTFIHLVDQLPSHPALLFHLAYRNGDRAGKEMAGHCPGANQSVTCCQGLKVCKRWWEMSDYVSQVLREYKIPYVSYRDLTWPVLLSPPPLLGEFWNGLSHPDAKAHALMGKLISFAFYLNLKHSLHNGHVCEGAERGKEERGVRYVSSHQEDTSIALLCPSPLTSMMGGDTPDSQATFQTEYAGRNWRYYADSKLKFGYILNTSSCSVDCDGERDNLLILRVNMSSLSPNVQVFYLKSFHESMGEVEVFFTPPLSVSHAASPPSPHTPVSPRPPTLSLTGQWSLRVDNNYLANEEGFRIPFSVTRVATISRDELEGVSSLVKGDHSLLPSLQGGEMWLHLLPKKEEVEKRKGKGGLKFKLIGVMTC